MKPIFSLPFLIVIKFFFSIRIHVLFDTEKKMEIELKPLKNAFLLSQNFVADINFSFAFRSGNHNITEHPNQALKFYWFILLEKCSTNNWFNNKLPLRDGTTSPSFRTLCDTLAVCFFFFGFSSILPFSHVRCLSHAHQILCCDSIDSCVTVCLCVFFPIPFDLWEMAKYRDDDNCKTINGHSTVRVRLSAPNSEAVPTTK